MKTKWISCVLLITVFSVSGQNSQINLIRTKYVNWLSGSTADYARPAVMTRYNALLSNYNGAINLSAYNFNNPGPAWDLTNATDKSQFWGICYKLLFLSMIYSTTGPSNNPNPHFQEPALRSVIFQIFDYIQAKGVSATSNLGNYYNASTQTYGLGNSVILRIAAYANSIMLMRNELESTGRLAHHMGALDNFTYVWSPENTSFNFAHAGTNADGIKSIGEARLVYVLCEADNAPDRIADMERYTAFLNNGLQIAPGWADMIKPDFMTYHHEAAYPTNYGGTSLMVASILQWMLDGSAYELSATASGNIRETLLAYRKYTLGYNWSSSLAGRFPGNSDLLIEFTYAFAMSYLCDPVNNLACGQEFTRLFKLDSPTITNRLVRKIGAEVSLYHTLGGAQLMEDVLAQHLTDTIILRGSFGFPSAGLSVHKSNTWMVSQKGTSKHIWHYEGTSSENVFGRFNSAGNMEIFNSPHFQPRTASGLTWAGWDWSKRPGSTTYYLTSNELRTTSQNGGHRKFSSKDYLVNGTFGLRGTFGMDYEDVNSPEKMSVKKSSFFFGDLVLCLVSDFEHLDHIHHVYTNLFQTSLSDPSLATYTGSTPCTGLNYHYVGLHPGFGFTDAANNAYYVISADDSLHIRRMNQSSFDPNGNTPTTGNFISAWIDHGTQAEQSSVAYCIQLNGGPAAATNLPTTFVQKAAILRNTDSIQAVLYKPDTTYAFNAFYANPSINIGPVLSLNHPGAVFAKQTGENRLTIGYTSPDLGIYPEGIYYNSIPSWAYFATPSTRTTDIRITGDWNLVSANGDVSVHTQNNVTTLHFTHSYGRSIECNLILNQLKSGLEEHVLQTLEIYPNPGTGIFELHIPVPQGVEGVLRIYNSSGQLMRSVRTIENITSIDLSNFGTGYYTVTYESQEVKLSSRLIQL